MTGLSEAELELVKSGTFEIRGEIVMSKDEFTRFNNEVLTALGKLLLTLI